MDQPQFACCGGGAWWTGTALFQGEIAGTHNNSGLTIAGSDGDSVRVRGVITDEVAIEKVSLEIDGIDATGQMTVTALAVGDDEDAVKAYEHAWGPDSFGKTVIAL